MNMFLRYYNGFNGIIVTQSGAKAKSKGLLQNLTRCYPTGVDISTTLPSFYFGNFTLGRRLF